MPLSKKSPRVRTVRHSNFCVFSLPDVNRIKRSKDDHTVKVKKKDAISLRFVEMNRKCQLKHLEI